VQLDLQNPQPNFNRNPFPQTQQNITNNPNFNIKQTIKRPRPADSDQSRMSIDELRLQDAREYGPTDPNCNQLFMNKNATINTKPRLTVTNL